MIANPSDANAVSLAYVEGGLVVILFCFSFLAPRLGNNLFTACERRLGPLAAQKRAVVVATAFAVLLGRLALLPLFPIPLPNSPDDFSFLLQADTFLHARLANPVPALWQHFETMHVTLWPTYVSMYFPAQALVMAAGKAVFGQMWFGLLVTMALACAALVWALQAWLPAKWALLGALLVVLRIGLFSYWINSYTGAGSICMLGGALIVGAWPRLIRHPRLRYTLALALGAGLLVISRPFEGLLLCLPVSIYLLLWLCKGKNRPSGRPLFRLAVPAALLLAVAIGWLGYYNFRAFGNASTMPYTVDRAQYAVAPYYVWQPLRPTPQYRHQALRAFYAELSPNDNGHSGGELDFYLKMHSWKGFLPGTIIKLLLAILFYTSGALLIPLLMTRRLFLDRRVRPLLVCALVLAAGMLVEIYLIPHYVAPFTALFYVLGLQAMRHLRLWTPEGKPSGRFLVRIAVSLCLLMAVVRVVSAPMHWLPVQRWPVSSWFDSWYGPDHFGTERQGFAQTLENKSGKQLVIVTYDPLQIGLDEWVYNSADLDEAKVVWARDMGPEQNQELIRHYGDRKAWLLQRAGKQATLLPYPAQAADLLQTSGTTGR